MLVPSGVKRVATLKKDKVHHWQVSIKVGFAVKD